MSKRTYVEGGATITDEQREQFADYIQAHPGCGYIEALTEIGIQGTKGQLHELVKREGLKEVWNTVHAQVLFRAIWRHGVEGVAKPVYSASGKYAGDTTEYSSRDRALLAKIVRLDPGVQVRHGGIAGEPLQLTATFDPSLLNDDELMLLQQLLQNAQPDDGDGAGTPLAV